jgi:sulfur-carrier protein
MPRVELARHLYRFFPHLEGRDLTVEAGSVRDVVGAIEAIAPGFASYVVDEHGAMRPHVNIFIGDELVVDRVHLSDPVHPDARVSIFQALSGG